MNKKVSSESVFKYIRSITRKKYSSEEKIRIVIDGLRGEDSISSLCRREGIPANLYYCSSKDFLKVVRSVLQAIPLKKPGPLKCLTLKNKMDT